MNPSLFDQPSPGGFHTADPATSRSAATDPTNMVRWGTQRHKLLSAYVAAPDGLLPDRAGERAGVGGYSPRRRSSELEAAGLIEPSGEVIDGKRVMRATEAGVAALRSVAAA